MRVEETGIPGCYRLLPRVISDERGRFVKTFHEVAYQEAGLRSDFREQYYSTSHRGVLRGMHFQTPPNEHAKVVYCLHGTVLDALVDLRRGSPTFGRAVSITLDGSEGGGLYVPPGLAHGFLTLSETATMLYNVTSVHAPQSDTGVRWDSIGIEWPQPHPITSPRDAAFPALGDFETPFTWHAGGPEDA